MVDNAEDEYEELRILAEAAGMAEENDADDENDSDYVPSEEEEDDDMSLGDTEEEMTEEDHVETAITETWQIYLMEKSRRALRELSELVGQLRSIRREQRRAERE
jgi:hypothetical protein